MSVFRLVSCITMSSEPNTSKSSPCGKYKSSPVVHNLAYFVVHQEVVMYSLLSSQNFVLWFAPRALKGFAFLPPEI